MRRTRIIISLIGYCLLALQCTGRQEAIQQPIQFYLEQDFAQITKSSLKLEPTALFPEGGQVDTLWIAAVSREIKTEDTLTKGIPYNSSTGFPLDGELGLIAYQYDEHGDSVEDWTVYTEEDGCSPMTYVSDTGRWIPTPDLYYPGGEGFLRFFAFGPNDLSVTGISAGDEAGPVISYAVPAAVANQRGFLVSRSVERGLPPRMEYLNVPLRMSHVLSGVRFAVGLSIDVVSFTVSGVYDQGDYDMLDGAWDTLDKIIPARTYTISITNYATDMVPIDEYLARTAPEHTMMMIPQRLPEGARISVQLEGEALPRVINVSGQLWEKGKETTYILMDQWANFSIIVGDYPSNTEDPLDDE